MRNKNSALSEKKKGYIFVAFFCCLAFINHASQQDTPRSTYCILFNDTESITLLYNQAAKVLVIRRTLDHNISNVISFSLWSCL